MELSALMDQNTHLQDFDGGRIKCVDPTDMKEKRSLHEMDRKDIS